MSDFHARDVEFARSATQAPAEGGLASTEARARLARFGPNRLIGRARPGALARAWRQFDNVLIQVLMISGAIVLALGHTIDAVVIFGVVAINAAVGFFQEGKAEDALAGIAALVDPKAAAIRDGARVTLPVGDIVPGDLVVLEAGEHVPADLRLVRASRLAIDESALTGESLPVEKSIEPVDASAPLAERRCMAYAGTTVAAGAGLGLAVATGRATELGRIGTLIGEVRDEASPLVRRMDAFGRRLTFAILVGSAAVFAVGYLAHGFPAAEMFLIAVGLAVATIPEGLPAVMTIALAVGVRRMAARRAIIRRLPAVETLGAVSVICTDKTGTLTLNEMRVVETRGAAHAIALAAALCNDATLKDGRVEGDAMEGALLRFAAETGVDPARARADHPRVDEVPFDAAHRYMSTRHSDGALWIKGAPEAVLALCPGADVAHWQEQVEELADAGRRVLGFAARSPGGAAPEFLGLVGLADPPRPEVARAVAECRAAGIAIKMITGDHARTAAAIARELKLADDVRAVEGKDLAAEGFAAAARRASVFARTSPEDKLRLVEALQADGGVVTMTGDGVNDAPALKRADVGVAMGARGTHAAKDASDIVLVDDNFATIVAAVREGRTVHDNIAKVVAWTFPTNGGMAMLVIGAVLFGLYPPVSPAQILWINMVTAVALGLTLAFEPGEPGAMTRPPRDPAEPLLTGELLWRIGFVSALMGLGAFLVHEFAQARGLDEAHAHTASVNAVVAMQIAYLFSVRYAHGPSLTLEGLKGTRAVLIGVGLTLAAQAAFTYAPPMNALFATAPSDLGSLAAACAAGAALFVLAEIDKGIRRRRSPQPHRPQSRR
jgi:calcium-translocating P-type ATPase